MSLASLLFDAPEGVAVIDGSSQVTRLQLAEQATDLASRLVASGLESGAPVGVMLPNNSSAVAALFGVWRAGGVYLPLNPRMSQPELDRTVAEVPPAAVVTTPDQSDRFGEIPVVTSARPARAVDRYGEDVALISFTSGTTGPPKPVPLRHSSVLSLIDAVLETLRGGRPNQSSPMANLIPVSLSLWAGIYNVLFAFRAGAPVVLMASFDTRTFADLVRRHQIRSVVLPPAAMAMLTDDPSISDLHPLRYVRSITAPLSPLQARRFHSKFGVRILNGYGQTELGGEVIGWSAADSREHGEEKLGSVGRPHPGVEIRVVGEGGETVAPGEVGELWVRAPGAVLPDRVSADGFLQTGDLARVDEEGFVWIEGRISEMVNRGGLKVYPAEVEEVLRLDPEVTDVAVVGAHDERLGEVPWAFVVPASAAEERRLSELCRLHLAPYKIPVRFVGVEALPRNEVGKVIARQLLEGSD